MKRMRFAAFVFVNALTASAPAYAQSASDLEAARRLFDAGAQAYASGQFTAAIQAFDQANRLVPKPAILFSLAQAQRRQYFIDKNPQQLRAALVNYRAYLHDGPRRADAAQAVAELDLMEARLGEGGGAGARALVREPARLMIVSRRPGTMASVDGRAPRAAPFAIEVSPGPHRVRVTADGCYPEERDAVAVENAISPVDVPLREKPAVVQLVAPHGADVIVDGKVIDQVGARDAIEVPAGTRFIALTKNGRQSFAMELDLKGGERRRIEAPMPVTQQRIFAYGFLTAAGASAVVSGVFAVRAFMHESNARDIEDRRNQQNIVDADRVEYENEVAARDRARTGAYISLGVAAGAGAVGALLWLFDQPPAPLAPGRRFEPSGGETPAREPTEVGIGPGPGLAGVSLERRF